MPYWRLQSETAIKCVDNRVNRATAIYDRNYVRHVAWQPGPGGVLACVTRHGGRLVNTGILKKDSMEFGAEMGFMEQLAWSPAGDMLATVHLEFLPDLRKRAVIWNPNGTVNRELDDVPTWASLYITPSYSKFDAPKFSKDGSFVVVSHVIVNLQNETFQRLFSKFDTSTGAVQQSFRIPIPNEWTALVWKGELELFCEGLNKTINLWRIGQEGPLQSITHTGYEACANYAFNPKMNILAFYTSPSPTVSLWKTDTPDMAVSLLTDHDEPVAKIFWQSDHSDILVAFDRSGGVRIWETTSQTPLHQYNTFDVNLDTRYISFSPDGRFIALPTHDEHGETYVKIVKFDTGDTVAVCEGLGVRELNSGLKWNPRGGKLAANLGPKSSNDFGGNYIPNLFVFNVDNINFGINLKRLSLIRVASLLEGNLVNGKEEARNFLETKIPEKLVDDVLPYLM